MSRSRFREAVPVGLPGTPRPPGRGFSGHIARRSSLSPGDTDVPGGRRDRHGRRTLPGAAGTWIRRGVAAAPPRRRQTGIEAGAAEYQGWFEARSVVDPCLPAPSPRFPAAGAFAAASSSPAWRPGPCGWLLQGAVNPEDRCPSRPPLRRATWRPGRAAGRVPCHGAGNAKARRRAGFLTCSEDRRVARRSCGHLILPSL